jgi:uncharacterized membrane protein YqgA involved in biofilm formation
LVVAGALWNGLGIAVGAGLGLVARRGLRAGFQPQAERVLGLVVGWIGLQMTSQYPNPPVLLVSLVIGGWLGGLLNIQGRIAAAVQRWTSHVRGDLAGPFVNATLLFNVGALALVGAIQAGTTGHAPLLKTKALLDGTTAALLAATGGPGVLGSAVPTAVYEGIVSELASPLQRILTPSSLHALDAIGGLMIVGISANLLAGREWVKVADLLPGLVIAPLLAWGTNALGVHL